MADITKIQENLRQLNELEQKMTPEERLAYIRTLNNFVVDVNRRMALVLDAAATFTPQ